VKRALYEESYENEAVQKTANDLRNMVKKAEADKADLNRQIQEAKQRIAG